MKHKPETCFYIILLTCLAMNIQAESVYITDSLNIGLHEDKTIDSPIIKVVSSGTRLELIKREDSLSFVSDASGATGWVDNTYLETQPPAVERIRTLTARNNTLEQQIKGLQSGSGGGGQGSEDYQKLVTENEDLQQKFNSERLKVGELQATVTELKKRVGQDSNLDSLYEEIETLREQNKDLEVRLANAMEESPVMSSPGTAAAMIDEEGQISFGWKNFLISSVVLLVLGLSGGIYLMDYINRRRHGGFRI